MRSRTLRVYCLAPLCPYARLCVLAGIVFNTDACVVTDERVSPSADCPALPPRTTTQQRVCIVASLCQTAAQQEGRTHAAAADRRRCSTRGASMPPSMPQPRVQRLSIAMRMSCAAFAVWYTVHAHNGTHVERVVRGIELICVWWFVDAKSRLRLLCRATIRARCGEWAAWQEALTRRQVLFETSCTDCCSDTWAIGRAPVTGGSAVRNMQQQMRHAFVGWKPRYLPPLV